MIVDAIKDIKITAQGTDHFPSILMKECAEELSEPLFILWRYSLDSRDITALLKSAVISGSGSGALRGIAYATAPLGFCAI